MTFSLHPKPMTSPLFASLWCSILLSVGTENRSFTARQQSKVCQNLGAPAMTAFLFATAGSYDGRKRVRG